MARVGSFTMFPGNTFGHLFTVTTFGESHGAALGCVVDGCPAGLALDVSMIQADLDRRRPGATRLGTKRNESDRVEILSGVHDGHTLGTPIAMILRNEDARSKDYSEIAKVFRPSHGDFSYQARYGRRDPRGGGRASARETVGRVAAGAVARALLAQLSGVEVCAWVSSVADIQATVDSEKVSMATVDASEVRCPDAETAKRMVESIEAARKEGDTLGGTLSAVARNVPAGWGAPVFGKLDAALAAALVSIPAVKGVEVGSGFAGTRQKGSEHNDPFYTDTDGNLRTWSNNSGGIQAGISNGMPILVQAAFKPVATHFKEQETVTVEGDSTRFSASGRHDPCVLPRAVPIVEAMLLLCLADAALGARLAQI